MYNLKLDLKKKIIQWIIFSKILSTSRDALFAYWIIFAYIYLHI